MPVILRWRGHRFLFYFPGRSVNRHHIHVLKDAKQLKVWLAENFFIRVARNVGFATHEVNDILGVVAENRAKIPGGLE